MALTSGDKVNGIVVRPVCVYGGSGSYFADYHFKPALEALKAKKESFESIIGPSGKILTIHKDDAADLIVRVAEAVSMRPKSMRCEEMV